MVLDYKRLQLKAGLEIHQQLDTNQKLFCSCSTKMEEKEPVATVKRKMHPVASELGEIDVAAQFEYLRDRTFIYQVFKNEVCLVELDEEPPHPLNEEALEIALQIALMLNCTIPNEIHVMRKTLIDGSAISGFQRTAIIGLNGFLDFNGRKIPIKHVSLEEDAAALVKEEDGKAVYRLNRLGVPLVEIGTGLLVNLTPKEIQEIAFRIGMICRSTRKCKRGIGSIRQDVNVSIKNGARVEIKGVQELNILAKIIEYEVRRQLSLIEIKEELKRKGLRKLKIKPVDVTKVLKKTKCKILRKVLEKKGSVFALKLPKFSGLLKKELCPGKTLGRELADFVSAFGVKGIIHSDEDLEKYQLKEDFERLRKVLKAEEDDAIILIGEFKEKGKVASLLAKKCEELLLGPQEETRAANPDGTTRFIRPLPGAARLYPETDIEPIIVSKELIKKLKQKLPEPWTRKLERFKKKLKLSEDLAKQVLRSEYLDLFEEIIEKFKVEPSIVASFLVSTLKELRREGLEIEKLTDEDIKEIFRLLNEGKIVKEAIIDLVKEKVKKPSLSFEDIIKKLKLEVLSKEELERIVKKVIEENKGKPVGKIIGIVMSKVRGRAKAEDVVKLVKENL